MHKEYIQRVWFILALLLLVAALFRELLVPGHILFTTDDNLGSLVMRKQLLPQAWWGGWNPSELLGFPAPMFLNLTNLLLWIFPAVVFNNWIQVFDLLVGSVLLMAFLRGRGVGWAGCSLGVLTVYWLGSNFTLIYAGHIGKFGILLWAAAYLCLVEAAVRYRSMAWSILAGAALGAMFLEQADVGLFFALGLGPYALFAYIREAGTDWRGMARLVSPLVGVAFLLSVHPLLSGYRSAVEGVAAVQEEDPGARWHFITQWSWPPEESIDFIAPGFTGWRTGEPAGPYTGRMGRTEGWERTGEGFRNFKLENQYVGAIPLFFAVWAAVMVWPGRRRRDRRMWDMGFWLVVCGVALLLSLGKYFPLYALFYQLPVVSSIRNPNKFLQVFQLALGISAAMGLQACAHAGSEGKAAEDGNDRAARFMVLAGGVLALLLLAAGLYHAMAESRLIARWTSEWGRYADVIIANRRWALWHGGLMAALAAAWMYVGPARRMVSARTTGLLSWGLVACMVFDVLFLARPYVASVPAGSMKENEVIRIIRSEGNSIRTALLSRDGFYNHWLTLLFPYHDVQTIEVAQMPRMPVAYQNYLNAVGRNPTRHWELGAVGFILAPEPVWGQIQSNPELRGRFALEWAYNVFPNRGGVRVAGGTPTHPGQHVVLRHLVPHPRAALIQGWEVVEDEVALRRLADPRISPFEQVWVAPGQGAERWPVSTGSGIVGSIDILEQVPGHWRLRVKTQEPVVLRIADKFDPDWRASLNGQRVDVTRVDYLFKGVFVPPGTHEITLRYAPPKWSLGLQGMGMALACIAAAWVAIRRNSVGSPRR